MDNNKPGIMNALKQFWNGAVYSKVTLSKTDPGNAALATCAPSSSFTPESTIVSSIQDFIANDVASQTFTHVFVDPETMVQSARLDSPIYELLNMNVKDGMTSSEFWTTAIKRMLTSGYVFITPVYSTDTDGDDAHYASANLIDLEIADARPDDISHTIVLKSPYNQGLQAKDLMSKAYALLWDNMGDTDLKGYISVNGIVNEANNGFEKRMNQTMANFYRYVGDYKIGVLDNKSEYHELNNDYRKISPADLDSLKDEIYAIFGVDKDIITGNATLQEMSEYKQRVIAPINQQLTTELNRVLLSGAVRTFTSKKVANGNQLERIGIYSNKYQYASLSDLSAVIQQATNAGIATRNELRDIIGLPPEPNGSEIVSNLNNVVVGNSDESGNDDADDSEKSNK